MNMSKPLSKTHPLHKYKIFLYVFFYVSIILAQNESQKTINKSIKRIVNVISPLDVYIILGNESRRKELS